MKINIENIGQIERADIKLDGITIIAGENNTGKSTVGKSLFAVLRGMNSWDTDYLEICASRLHEKIKDLSVRLEEFCLENTAAARRTNRANALVLELCKKEEFIVSVEDYQVTGEKAALCKELENFCTQYVGLYQKDKIKEVMGSHKGFIYF